MANDPDPHDVKTALDHAWAWFSLHASQRMQSVNFFLVAAAFLTAAFVTALKEQMHAFAAVIAALGGCTSYIFFRMGLRVRSLLHAAEHAIRPLEDKRADAVGIKELRIVAIVEDAKVGEWKYSKVFRWLYVSTGIAFALGFLYAVWVAVGGKPPHKPLSLALQFVVGTLLAFFGYEMLVGASGEPEADAVKKASRICLCVSGAISVLAAIAVFVHLVFWRL